MKIIDTKKRIFVELEELDLINTEQDNIEDENLDYTTTMNPEEIVYTKHSHPSLSDHANMTLWCRHIEPAKFDTPFINTIAI